MRSPFVWQGAEHWHTRDLLETLQLIDAEEDAADFIETYTAVCDDEDHALHNVRYLVSLVPSEDRERLAELFMVDLPEPDADPLMPRQWFAGSSLGVKS